uniref:PHD finger protein 7 n=1 Tax=Rhinopithecus roxellana TaxID=61622 RepID=A0A2K6QL04_RHIRO
LQEPGDPEKLGEFLQKDNISVLHLFCLIFISILSSKLPQRGQSNRGKGMAIISQNFHVIEKCATLSALCARKRELLSTARRISASETSICLVAKKGVAFHNFLESTNHFVTNIGRKAASCVVKTYPNRVLRTSRARVVVKPSTTASAYRNMPTHQQSISSNVHSNGNSYSRQEVVPHSVCYMRIPWNPQGLLLS